MKKTEPDSSQWYPGKEQEGMGINRNIRRANGRTPLNQTKSNQRSWEPGEVPADWKLASVIPIYKKGVRQDPWNYRPVSLTSVPGKIMEKIILSTTERHLKSNAIIRHTQHGFTKE
ncbi:hypothetical protein QYF61_022684 [Mycteria americana]|uniref:Reverse transcriptase domain-containing protein n=1 Tax=Mycteria americana TaxID=33587 RepID=A0AAN7NM77_MYCAM|nr:hypothetical protein QYF61_022684 [Mycteria americana]